jgi:hypothetical protein
VTIIRQAHHRRQFVSISNSLAQNNSLSLKARGLMLYLLSLPEDWKVHVNHLAKIMVEGKSAILSALIELKGAGYIWHQKLGFKEGWTYWVFEVPCTDAEFKEFLRTNRFSNNSETEQFENQQLQKTYFKDIQPTSSTKATPPTKEEEEEIDRRIKERPPGSKKIKYPKRHREKMLENMREEKESSVNQEREIKRRRGLAMAWDGKISQKMSLVACKDHVEFNLGSYSRIVRYDVSEEEWKEKTGWE